MRPTLDSQARLEGLSQALHAGAYEAASGLFLTLLRRSPHAPDFGAWLLEGWTSFDTAVGRHALSQAITAALTDELAALLLFARVAFGAGHAGCAVAASRQAMIAAPDQAAPTFLLCAMLLKQASPDAQSALRRCLDAFPQPSQGWTDLGDVLLGLGKKEAALVCFARGAPDFSTAMRRGSLAKDLGHHQQARAAFAMALKLNPEAPRAWFLLGTCAQDERDFGAAAQAYRTALTLAPTLAEAAVNLGTVLQETGELAGAKAAYGRALAIRPDTFGRVAQALSTSPTGELWLSLDGLRGSLAG